MGVGTKVVVSTSLIIPFTVGQGPAPELVARLAFETARDPGPLQWVDVSDRVRSWSVSRGGENELDLIDAGTATLVLDNRDRDLDPFNTSSPYSPNVRPRRRMWLQTQDQGQTVDQFYGWTGSFQPEWAGHADAIVNLEASDGLMILAGDALPTSNPPRDSYADVVLFDQPISFWPFNDPGRPEAADTVGDRPLTYGNNNYLWHQPALIVGDNQFAVSNNGSSTLLSDGNWPFANGWSAGFTIEIWFEPSNLVAAVNQAVFGSPDTSSSSLVTAITVSINNFVPQFGLRTGAAPGTLTTLSSSVTVANGDVLHLVASYDGATMRLRVNDVEASVAKTGTIPFDTSGTADLWGFGQATSIAGGALGTWDEGALYGYALTAARASAHHEAGTEMGHHQAGTDEHVAVALEESGLHFIPRRLRTGQREIQPVYFTGQSPREWVDDACRAEGEPAMCFIAKDGAAVFLDKNHRTISPWNTAQAIFDDDGTDTPYVSMTPDDGAGWIRNDIRITRKDGELQRTFDPTSIDEYDRIDLTLETLNVSDADAAAEATALLAKYKDPLPRITALELHGADYDLRTQMLTRELGDCIRVIRRPYGGGSAIDQTSFIRKIVLSGSDDDPYWSATWAVSPR